MIATRPQIVLRPYQTEAVKSARSLLKENASTLIVQPTGTGKTIVFADIINDWHSGRVLVMAHRDELIRQAADKIEWVTGEPCDIEMGDYRADQCALPDRKKVVITSVQTMSRARRLAQFHADEFSLLIIDEAHHAPAPTYQAVIEYFSRNRSLRVLGVTATPDRADELALGRVFETVAYDYQLLDAINDGWLVPIQQQFVHVEGLDLSEVNTVAGDLNQRQMAEILNEEKLCHRIVSPVMDIAADEPTLIFAATVAQAETMCEIANRRRPGCADWICGDQVKCPRDVRRETLKHFSSGEFQFLFNVGVLLEGYDEPSIGIVACARPTKSRSLYAQMIGRGTRTLPGVVDGVDLPEGRLAAIAASGKPSLLILDFVGNSGNHKLIHTGDILGGNYDDEIVAAATHEAMNKGTAGERTDMLAELRAAEEARKEVRRLKRQRVVADAKFSTRAIDPFEVLDIMPKREPGWHVGRKPTEKQVAYLKRQGISTHDMSFCKASQLIGETIKRREKKLCTFKQAKLLVKFGESPDVGVERASELITAIRANRWRPLPKKEVSA